MIEQTLAIIKPDGVARNLIGAIIRRIEEQGLTVKALKMAHLSKKQAEGFYAVHRERPFFNSLTTFMSEGPVVLMILSGEGAISSWRDLMGATDSGQGRRGDDPQRIRHFHRAQHDPRLRWAGYGCF